MNTNIADEIHREQKHGRQKYGHGPDDLERDDQHAIADWCSFIHDHTDQAQCKSELKMEARQHLIKVAGLAISAVEAIDRAIQKQKL